MAIKIIENENEKCLIVEYEPHDSLSSYWWVFDKLIESKYANIWHTFCFKEDNLHGDTEKEFDSYKAFKEIDNKKQ